MNVIGREEMIMLFRVIEKYKDKEAVYKRFHEKGRMMPEGVSYMNSWVTISSQQMSEKMSKGEKE